MKRTILFALFVMALSAKSFAGNKNTGSEEKEKEASYFAQNNFQAKFQDAKEVKWTVGNNYQKASFVLDGIKKSAFFNQQGDFIATTEYIKADKLPADSQQKLKKQYKDYSVAEILKYDVEDSQDAHLFMLTGRTYASTVYFASLKKKDSQIVVKIEPGNDISFFKNL